MKELKRKMAIKFDDFLIEKHATQYTGTKDGMIDDVNRWISVDLTADDWIELAAEFTAKELLMRGLTQ